MKNRSTTVCGVLLLFVVLGFSPLASPQDREKTRVKLALSDRNTQPAPPISGELTPVSGSVELDLKQSRTQGISAEVSITNTADVSVRILDPTAFSHLEVQTEDGWPVEVPSTAGVDVRINRSARPGEPKHRQPAIVELATNKAYAFTLRVTEVYPIVKRSPDAWAPQGAERQSAQRTPVPLPPGKYKVRVVCTLVAARDGEPISRGFVSPFTEITVER